LDKPAGVLKSEELRAVCCCSVKLEEPEPSPERPPPPPAPKKAPDAVPAARAASIKEPPTPPGVLLLHLGPFGA